MSLRRAQQVEAAEPEGGRKPSNRIFPEEAEILHVKEEAGSSHVKKVRLIAAHGSSQVRLPQSLSATFPCPDQDYDRNSIVLLLSREEQHANRVDEASRPPTTSDGSTTVRQNL